MLSATRPTLKLTSMFVNIFRSDQEYARRESHIEREVYAARLLQLEAKVKSLLQLTMLISSARPGGMYYAKQSTFPFSGTYFQLPMSEVCPVFAFLSSVGLFSALFLLRTLPSLLP